MGRVWTLCLSLSQYARNNCLSPFFAAAFFCNNYNTNHYCQGMNSGEDPSQKNLEAVVSRLFKKLAAENQTPVEKKEGKIHFKLTHEGVTRRFALSRGEKDLISVLKVRVLEIVGGEEVTLYWKDNESRIVLETIDDIAAAIDYAETKNKLGCITIDIGEVLKKKNYLPEKVDGKEVTAEESEEAFDGHAFMCDACDSYLSPSNGGRFMCMVCPNFDLCTACHANGTHDNHAFAHLLNGKTAIPFLLPSHGVMYMFAKQAPRCTPTFISNNDCEDNEECEEPEKKDGNDTSGDGKEPKNDEEEEFPEFDEKRKAQATKKNSKEPKTSGSAAISSNASTKDLKATKETAEPLANTDLPSSVASIVESTQPQKEKERKVVTSSIDCLSRISSTESICGSGEPPNIPHCTEEGLSALLDAAMDPEKKNEDNGSTNSRREPLTFYSYGHGGRVFFPRREGHPMMGEGFLPERNEPMQVISRAEFEREIEEMQKEGEKEKRSTRGEDGESYGRRGGRSERGRGRGGGRGRTFQRPDVMGLGGGDNGRRGRTDRRYGESREERFGRDDGNTKEPRGFGRTEGRGRSGRYDSDSDSSYVSKEERKRRDFVYGSDDVGVGDRGFGSGNNEGFGKAYVDKRDEEREKREEDCGFDCDRGFGRRDYERSGRDRGFGESTEERSGFRGNEGFGRERRLGRKDRDFGFADREDGEFDRTMENRENDGDEDRGRGRREYNETRSGFGERDSNSRRPAEEREMEKYMRASQMPAHLAIGVLEELINCHITEIRERLTSCLNTLVHNSHNIKGVVARVSTILARGGNQEEKLFGNIIVDLHIHLTELLEKIRYYPTNFGDRCDGIIEERIFRLQEALKKNGTYGDSYKKFAAKIRPALLFAQPSSSRIRDKSMNKSFVGYMEVDPFRDFAMPPRVPSADRPIDWGLFASWPKNANLHPNPRYRCPDEFPL